MRKQNVMACLMALVFILGMSLSKDVFAQVKTSSNQKYVKENKRWEFEIKDGTLERYNGDGGEIVIPNTVLTIKENAFLGNDNITKVTIPGSVQNIKWDAFKKCKALKEVVFEPGTTLTIRSDAFSYCPKLSTIEIPAHANYIVANVFKGSSALKEIKVAKGNPNYFVKDGVLFGKAAKPNTPSELIDPPVLKLQAYPAGKDPQNYKIPETVDGLPVTSVFAGAFESVKTLKGIEITPSIKSLDWFAFRDTSLTEVYIPDTVESVGSSLFEGCSKLQKVHLPDHITAIPNRFFYGCTALTDFNFPKAVNSIEADAFKNCTSLNSVYLPNSLSLVEIGAFDGCKNLSRVAIPSTIQMGLNYDPFENCSRDLVVYVEMNSFADKWLEKNELVKDLKARRYRLKKLVSPADVGDLDMVLRNDQYGVSLKGKFPIGTNLSVVEEKSDQLLSKIKDPNVGNKKVLNIGLIPKGTSSSSKTSLAISLKDYYDGKTTAVYDLSGDEAILLPSSLAAETNELLLPQNNTGIYGIVDHSIMASSLELEPKELVIKAGESQQLQAIFTPDNVSYKKVTWESDNSSIAMIDQQGSLYAKRPGTATIVAKTSNGLKASCHVTVEGKNASDRYCLIKDGLLTGYHGPGGKVEIPSSVTSIKSEALKGNKEITEITIPASVTTIGYEAFENMPNLEKVTFEPGGTQLTIRLDAFARCPKLKTLVLPKHVKEITGNITKGSTAIKEVKLAGPVEDNKYIEQDGVIFAKNRDVEDNTYCLQIYPSGKGPDYTIPESVQGHKVTKTWPGALEGAEALKHITISRNLKELGTASFAESGLVDCTIPKTVEILGDSMFKKCKDLKSVTINAKAESIGQCFFEKCVALQDIKWPEDFKYLELYALRDCSAMTHLDLPEGFLQSEPAAFDGMSSLERIVVPTTFVKFGSDYALEKVNKNVTLYVPADTPFKASPGKQFAIEKGIRYIEYNSPEHLKELLSQKHERIIKDAATGIAVSGEMDPKITLNVVKKNNKIDNYDHAQIFQISLNGGKLEKGMLQIPVNDQFDVKTVKLLRKTDQGSFDDTAVKPIEHDGQMLFNVAIKDFASSIYAIVDETIYPKTLAFKEAELSMQQYEQKQLEFSPQISSNVLKAMQWEVEPEGIVRVDRQGQVYAESKGKATIKASLANGTSATCHITVGDSEKPVEKKLTLESDKKTITFGEEAKIKAIFTPDGTGDVIQSWKIKSGSVGKASIPYDKRGDFEATVVAKSGYYPKAGKITVVATSKNGLTAECQLEIVAPKATDVEIWRNNNQSNVIAVGQSTSYSLNTSIKGAEFENLKLDFNKEIIDAQLEGNKLVIKGKKPGKTLVTVLNEEGFADYIEITVRSALPAIKSIMPEQETYEIPVGTSVKLKFKADPSDYVVDPLTDIETFYTQASYATKPYDENIAILPDGTVYAKKVGESMFGYVVYRNRRDENFNDTETGYSKIKVVANPSGEYTPIEKLQLGTLDGKTEHALNEPFKIVGTFTPQTATNQNLIFSYGSKASTKRKIARLLPDGRVYGKKPGTVELLAETADGIEQTITLTFTKEIKKAPVALTDINLSVAKTEVQEGESMKVTVGKVPENADGGIELKVDNPSLATIDQSGNFEAKQAGEVTIIATSGSIEKRVKVKITKAPVALTDINLSVAKTEVQEGESMQVTVGKVPENAVGEIQLKVDNPSLATLDQSGNFKAKQAGDVTIIATSGSIEKRVKVKITKAPVALTDINLSVAKTEVQEGESMQVTVGKVPENAGGEIQLKVDNPSLATIDQSGNFKAKQAGDVTIIAKCGSIEKQVKVKITKVSSKPQPNPRPENPSHPSIKPAPTPDRSGNFVTQPSNEVSKNLPKEENKNLTKQEELKKRRFIDTENHWAKHAIDYVVEKGYFKGVGNDRFAPNKSITRGDFVTVLGRMAGIDQSKYTSNPFSDLENNYATAYIIWAAENDIVKGVGNGKFESNRPITREEMAVVMSRYLYVTGKTLQDKQDVPFNDQSDISPWAQEAVKDMAKKGIVQGMENRCFSPKTSFTRAQVAQVLYNIDKNSK